MIIVLVVPFKTFRKASLGSWAHVLVLALDARIDRTFFILGGFHVNKSSGRAPAEQS